MKRNTTGHSPAKFILCLAGSFMLITGYDSTLTLTGGSHSTHSAAHGPTRTLPQFAREHPLALGTALVGTCVLAWHAKKALQWYKKVQREPKLQLLQAIQQNDLGKVINLIEQGVSSSGSVADHAGKRQSPLAWAAQSNQPVSTEIATTLVADIIRVAAAQNKECPICFAEPTVMPHITYCCSQIICEGCLPGLLIEDDPEDKINCPTCRSQTQTYNASFIPVPQY